MEANKPGRGAAAVGASRRRRVGYADRHIQRRVKQGSSLQRARHRAQPQVCSAKHFSTGTDLRRRCSVCPREIDATTRTAVGRADVMTKVAMVAVASSQLGPSVRPPRPHALNSGVATQSMRCLTGLAIRRKELSRARYAERRVFFPAVIRALLLSCMVCIDHVALPSDYVHHQNCVMCGLKASLTPPRRGVGLTWSTTAKNPRHCGAPAYNVDCLG